MRACAILRLSVNPTKKKERFLNAHAQNYVFFDDLTNLAINSAISFSFIQYFLFFLSSSLSCQQWVIHNSTFLTILINSLNVKKFFRTSIFHIYASDWYLLIALEHLWSCLVNLFLVTLVGSFRIHVNTE